MGHRGPRGHPLPERRPEDGRGRRRPGVPGSAHLAAAFCAPGRARPQPAQSQGGVAPAGRAPPGLPAKQPAAARNSPAFATAPPPPVSQAHPPLHRAVPWGPLAAPRLLPLNRPIRRRERHEWGRSHESGASRGRSQEALGRGREVPALRALTSLLRAGSNPGRGTGERRPDRGSRRDHAGHREEFPPAPG